MPKRVLRALGHHIDQHPRRFVATVVVLLVVSWGLAGWSLYRTVDIGREGRVQNCRALNELVVKIYVTLGDLSAPTYIQDRFVPTRNCEELP